MQSFGLGLAQQKVDVARCWSRPRAVDAVPQDLRAGTQHRPMEMRRAGIAFVTWKHVCAFSLCVLLYRCREGWGFFAIC
jgi:hypothetical protein